MLEDIDLSLKMTKDEYEEQLEAEQLRLLRAQLKLRDLGVPVIIMYEGWDAAGKGGSIQRITEKIDQRSCHVWPIGAPNEVERRYHYLWRFWNRLPVRGELAIFDRSWYGRVLVERVEKFAKKHEWERAYDEITNFEQTLIADGYVLIKFWLQISKDEQLRRFKEREKDPYKQWKIGPDDWRNREKWDDYVDAAEEMFARTHTPHAPWHLISAEDKHYARYATLRIVIDRLETALKKAE